MPTEEDGRRGSEQRRRVVGKLGRHTAADATCWPGGNSGHRVPHTTPTREGEVATVVQPADGGGRPGEQPLAGADARACGSMHADGCWV